ncbi:MAG: hypothetical protein E6I91_15170 [Chloroflexi bacterium]|nr:MAG: hypothetical protein E6I91_15170 [Chloroflexota bacterium]
MDSFASPTILALTLPHHSLFHHYPFQTRREATQTIFECVECFYNRVRRHSSLGSMSPVAYEQVMC